MRRLSLLLVFFFATLPSVALAAEPRIEQLSATSDGRTVSTRFHLREGFDAGWVEALRSGLPTTLIYRIELVRHRPNWFDDTIASSTVEMIATFNGVTQEYLLNYRRDRLLVQSEVFSELAALTRRMSSVSEEELFQLRGYRPSKLQVRVRADIGRGVLFYLVPRTISTGWRETRVRMAVRK